MTTTTPRLALLDALAAGPLDFGALCAAVLDPDDLAEEPLALADLLAALMAEGLVECRPGEEAVRYRLTAAGRAGGGCP